MKRKANLDILKLICAFLVVCIHMPFPGEIGAVVLAIARMAVPIFFMITGFFYRSVKERGREKQQILKVLKLTVFANILHFAWGLMFSFVTTTPAQYIAQTINSRAILQFLFLNESPFEIHLWYLTALLFALVILFFLGKRETIFRASYYCIPVLLLANLLIGKYAPVLWGRGFDLTLSRNFLFVGLPFLLLGSLLSEHTEDLKAIIGKRRWIPALMSACFVVLLLLEAHLLNSAGLENTGDNYIITPFLACSVFLFAVLAPDVKESNLLAKIGKATSTEVYIFHLIVKDVLAILLTGLFGSIYLWIRPVCVFVGSVALGLILALCRSKIKGLRQKQFIRK